MTAGGRRPELAEGAPTLVVAALPEEARALLARLGGREARPARRARPRGRRPWIVRGTLAGRPVAIVVTGDGERNAREGAGRAIESLAPARLLIIGVAGGLDPGLEPGGLVAGERVVDLEGAALAAEPSLVERAVRAGARRGVVTTSRRILCTPEAKAELRRAAVRNGGGRPGAPPVHVADLESGFYAAAAHRAGVPWGVLRAVSDGASDRLPAYLERCRDDGGAVRRRAVALRALARPWTLPSLLRLHARVRRSAERLADAVEAILSDPSGS